MTGKASGFSRDSDLTGLWSGEYWYRYAGSPTPFSAHIVDSLGGITGTTLEPNTFADPGLSELSADITGSRGDLTVQFTKIYHPASGCHRDPIYYSGVIDPDFTVIEGDWRFDYGFSGRFILTRVSRGAETVAVEREVELELKR